MSTQKLNWRSVDKKNYAASKGNFVFNLRKNSAGVYGMGETYLLSVRKKDDTRKINIASFWTEKDGGYGTYVSRSVNGKIWDNMRDIFEMSEKLLKNEFYI